MFGVDLPAAGFSGSVARVEGAYRVTLTARFDRWQPVSAVTVDPVIFTVTNQCNELEAVYAGTDRSPDCSLSLIIPRPS